MTRDELDAKLRSMLWGATNARNDRLAQELESVRKLLPATPLPSEWGIFVDALLNTFFEAPWSGVDMKKFMCAFALNQACEDAGGDPARFPAKVLAIYQETLKRKSSLRDRKKMAGAFAMANGFHPGPLSAACTWVVGKSATKTKPAVEGVLGFGERMGMTFPGLGTRAK